MNYWIACVGLTSANYLFQWMTEQQWLVAWERSFFQVAAVAAVAYLNWRDKA